jgi:Cu+-exporting ATPase
MRHLLNIPKPFTAKIYHPPSLLSRSKELHIREARRLTTLFAIALLFAIPTFVIAIVGMTILPSSNKFRMWCETPLWGGANRSIIILWILATFVQFGVGR